MTENEVQVGRGSSTEYAASAHLLTYGRLREISEGYLFPDELGIAWGQILGSNEVATLSDGEWVLLFFAYSLWTGQHHDGAGILDVRRALDTGAQQRVWEALEVRFGRRPVEELL